LFELPLLNTVILLSSGVRLKCNKFETSGPPARLAPCFAGGTPTNKFYTQAPLPFSSPRVLSTKRIGPHNYEVLSIRNKKRVSNLALRKEKSKCTDLVVLGTNLGSQVGSGRFTKQVSEMIKLPLFYRSVIVGLILSDAGLSFSSFLFIKNTFYIYIYKINKTAKNALLRLTQSLANSKYFLSPGFVFFILSPYCSNYPYYRERSRNGKINNSSPGLELFTRTLPCFTELYNLFYVLFVDLRSSKKYRIKIIPHNIYDLLTPVAIAHWIMGDGSAVGYGLRIGTDSYSVIECVQLINVLMIKYRIDCTIHMLEGKPRIYIPASSIFQKFWFKWSNLTWNRVCIINWEMRIKFKINKHTLFAISPVTDSSNIVPSGFA
jgi:hypothetical protein